MNKKLVILTVFALSIFIPTSYATTQNFSWFWTQCTGGQAQGTVILTGKVNSPYLTISWSVPSKSYEAFGVCEKTLLQTVNLSARVSTIYATAIPSTFASTFSVGSETLELQVITCGRTGCTQPHPYPVPYGATITVYTCPLYQIGIEQFSHCDTSTLKVTS